MSLSEQQYNDWAKNRKKHLESQTADLLFPLLRNGDKQALSMAITLVESKNPKHRNEADSLIERCLPYSGNSWRIGITGIPGVGKSTFIESFGKLILSKNKSLAVLAIDPSSSISGGSILGDKTRMHELSTIDKVFIRPSATGLNLGGVAQHTRETILLCEAAGFDVVFVETVGVGQGETLVHSMVDFFLLLMLTGAGDELQGIKRGIMEMADGILFTKADGSNANNAKLAQKELQNALQLFQAKESTWKPLVSCISSLEKTNLEAPFNWFTDYFMLTKENGYLSHKRNMQNVAFFEETFSNKLKEHIQNHATIHAKIEDLKTKIKNGELSPFTGAQNMFDFLFNTNNGI